MELLVIGSNKFEDSQDCGKDKIYSISSLNNVDEIIEAVNEYMPDVLLVDFIQMRFLDYKDFRRVFTEFSDLIVGIIADKSNHDKILRELNAGDVEARAFCLEWADISSKNDLFENFRVMQEIYSQNSNNGSNSFVLLFIVLILIVIAVLYFAFIY